MTFSSVVMAMAMTGALSAQTVTYLPYIQPGDSGPFGATDQMVVAWQTNETSANPGPYSVSVSDDPAYGDAIQFPVTGRVVDNYLSADPAVFGGLSIPTAYGAHVNYYAVLSGLKYDRQYYYQVTGPGMPAGGFTASFHTRTQGNHFSFEVQGDEGYYPGIPNTSPVLVANYEARIIHTMFDVDKLPLAGEPRLPHPDFALNTGDNVYIDGSDSNYHDVWFPTWNSNTDSNELGAPFIRSIPLYIVAGNHDVGSTGATANLLAADPPTVPGTSGPGPFGGNISGGDAMAYFNNYYFPLNGPSGVDIQHHFTGDTSTESNFLFSYKGNSYTSPLAIDALRASTTVNTGQGSKRQIDHQSNYSFDYGNAHVVFLDANPHLFDNQLPSPATYQAPPSFPFTAYPSVLSTWLMNDLDSSSQIWKVVVFHQPAFSSGNATLRNDQMRTIAKLLEDHAVNMVFNGHEHNYQRSLPIRALSTVAASPNPTGPAAVAVDQNFDGITQTVPDGVLYFVDGAGGNRDFDDALGNPRGSSSQTIDQEDSATGNSIPLGTPATSYPNGPNSWLDTHLTNTAMTGFFPTAGSGTKITARFKSKVFSFSDVVVNNNQLALYQISEPLTNTSSATSSNPYPFGTDIYGNRLKDPIPDTVVDPATGYVVSAPAAGAPALLDKITVTKPDLSNGISVNFSAPRDVSGGGQFAYIFEASNSSGVPLNGTQAIITLPAGVTFVSATGGTATVNGSTVVVTIGRFLTGSTAMVQVTVQAPPAGSTPQPLLARGTLRSATALPLDGGTVQTKVD
ncbi:MAG: metallophosphoesterase [Bryobacterales bacterium]|nr:metallophosphoesterase [Bryobacterales bacterium]